MNATFEDKRISLGIEVGSTRIKSVAIDEKKSVVDTGSYSWESQFNGSHWTYSLEDTWVGLKKAIPESINSVDAIGVSAMMHGYLAFDKNDELLTPFRTWRCESAARAANELSALFGFNIPKRWTIAHLYQAILDEEPHVKDIAFVTTLAGYIHWKLTGEKIVGIGDASGIFPVKDGGYNPIFAEKFAELTGVDIFSIFPKILVAGQVGGTLSEQGAALLGLSPGCPVCPPEGDAGTGMVATNAVRERTGNISAGTTAFLMTVLEKPLTSPYPEVDIVTTPTGKDVAMVHSNACTIIIDPWMKLFAEALQLFGTEVSSNDLYRNLYESALGDSNLSAFMKEKLVDAVKDLSDGMHILTDKEGVQIDFLSGHGGYFKSGKAGQTVMSEVLGVPIKLGDNAAEGGAWGIAVLADFMLASETGTNKQTLEDYLDYFFTKKEEI